MKRILRKITRELSQIEEVKAIILYGSFARDEYSSRSDIDLLILTTDEGIQRKIEDRIIDLESKIGRNIQPTIRTTDQLKRTDTGLLQNIFQEGRILYVKEPTEIPSSALLQQKPSCIFVFQMGGLSQREKARFNRHLYGQRKGAYDYKGLLQEIGGEKLSAGCVIVPYRQKGKIEKLFRRFKIEFQQLRVWK